MLIQLIIHLFQTIEAMMVTYLWFDNPLEGSAISMTLLMIAIGASGMCFGEAIHKIFFFLYRYLGITRSLT